MTLAELSNYFDSMTYKELTKHQADLSATLGLMPISYAKEAGLNTYFKELEHAIWKKDQKTLITPVNIMVGGHTWGIMNAETGNFLHTIPVADGQDALVECLNSGGYKVLNKASFLPELADRFKW